MFCAKCGSEISDGIKFCPLCGAPQAVHENPEDHAEAENTGNIEQPVIEEQTTSEEQVPIKESKKKEKKPKEKKSKPAKEKKSARVKRAEAEEEYKVGAGIIFLIILLVIAILATTGASVWFLGGKEYILSFISHFKK